MVFRHSVIRSLFDIVSLLAHTIKQHTDFHCDALHEIMRIALTHGSRVNT